MKKIFSGSIALVLLITACNRVEKPRDEKKVDIHVTMEKNDFVNIETTRKQYNAHSGDYFSSIDSVTQYGAGYVKKIDEEYRGYDVDIVVSAWMRENSAPMEGSLAVSVFAPSGIKAWGSIAPKAAQFKPNEWLFVQDTIRYTSSMLSEPGTEIKIFSVKPNGRDPFDIDDIKISYTFHK